MIVSNTITFGDFENNWNSHAQMRMFLCIIPNKPFSYSSFFTLKYNISTLLELYHLVLCNASITHNVHYEIIHSGNRTKWSPIQFVIIRVINKIGQPQSRSLICQSLIWLETELDDTKFCYQLIITITISEKKTSPVGTMSKAKNLEIFQFSFQGKWFLLWLLWSILWLVDLAEFGCFNCPITGVHLHCPVITVQSDSWFIKQLMQQLHLRKL